MKDYSVPKPEQTKVIANQARAPGPRKANVPRGAISGAARGKNDAGVGAWLLASPGTGGNIQSLALPPGDSTTLWVGSDNGGLMRGTLGKSWVFDGAQRGLAGHDIGDLGVVDLTTGTLTYAVAGAGFGPGGPADRRNLCVLLPGKQEWTPVILDEYTHVWPERSGPPPALGWDPHGKPDWSRTPNLSFRSPSLVCAIPLPSADGRHLLVLGGNNGSRQFADGLITLPIETGESYVLNEGVQVTPHENPPTFYVCIAQWKEGEYKRGPWVATTYTAERTVWQKVNTPTLNPDVYRRFVSYDRPSGVGGIWADPQIHDLITGSEVHIYFTIRLGKKEIAQNDKVVYTLPESYELGQLRVRPPGQGGLQLDLPSSNVAPRPLEFKKLESADTSAGLGQVAGIRQSGRLHLFYTAPLARAASCIRRLDEMPGTPGDFSAPSVVEHIGAQLKAIYGPPDPPKDATKHPDPVTYVGQTIGTFFHVRTTPDGWAYVAACKGGPGKIQLGAWRRHPQTAQWSRMSYQMGGAPGPRPQVSLLLTAGDVPLIKTEPVVVRIGVVIEKPLEGTFIDPYRLVAVVRYRGAGGAMAPQQTMWLDYFEEAELIDGVRWTEVVMNPAAVASPTEIVLLEVLLATGCAHGAAAVHVSCRPAGGGKCPQGLSPQWWPPSLGAWKVSAPAAWFIWEPGSAIGTLTLAGKPLTAPNMHRELAWHAIRASGPDTYDSIAVAAGPGTGTPGSGNRVALGRGDTQVFFSDDNGESFVPLGTAPVGRAKVGTDAAGSTTLALRWASTGLESMWAQGFHVATVAAAGVERPGKRLFSFMNDGGLFFSDDGGVSWVWAQPNVPNTRQVPYATPYAGVQALTVEDSRVVDVTAMVARGSVDQQELLLATCTVGVNKPHFGRVVVSRDGGWTWTGRDLCGLPEGAIWSLAEASGAVHVTVGGAGVYVLPAGTYTWKDTGEFRVVGPEASALQGAASAGAPAGVPIARGYSTESWRSALNPQRLAVVRDSHGVARWLVAALVADGMNPDWNFDTLVPDSIPGCGLWRLRLAPDGLPVPGATWTQISGLNLAGTFPNTWRAVSGLIWDGAKGLVVSTEESREGKRWFEGAVLWCEDVGAASPKFRLVMTHPKARGVAMHGKRLFVALGGYERVGDFGTSSKCIAAWQPRDDSSPVSPEPWGPGYNASKAYFKWADMPGSVLTEPTAPIGVFEVVGASGEDLWGGAESLPTQAELMDAVTILTSQGKAVDEAMKDLGHAGGWLADNLELKDLTGTLDYRNLARPISLQVLGSRLFVGLMGSGGWSRAL